MGRRQLSNADFIQRAELTHEGKYDYSETSYTSYHEKVKVICTDHGPFFQTPAKHLGGRGCPRCSGRKTPAQFIEAAQAVHLNRYDYSASKYESGNKKLPIHCREHGEFTQTPRDHLRGNGCPRCIGRNFTLPEFIERAKNQHGDRYDYRNVVFEGMEKKVEITCSRHGPFRQLASTHLKGSGCPKCSRNTSKAEHLWLDHIGVAQEHRRASIKVPGYKRALTVDAYDPVTKTIYEFYGDLWHGNPKIFPQDQPHRVAKTKGTYGDLYRRTVERENALKELGFSLVTIWESDWNIAASRSQ